MATKRSVAAVTPEAHGRTRAKRLPEDLHLLVQPVVHHQVVRHAHPVRLSGVGRHSVSGQTRQAHLGRRRACQTHKSSRSRPRSRPRCLLLFPPLHCFFSSSRVSLSRALSLNTHASDSAQQMLRAPAPHLVELTRDAAQIVPKAAFARKGAPPGRSVFSICAASPYFFAPAARARPRFAPPQWHAHRAHGCQRSPTFIGCPCP